LNTLQEDFCPCHCTKAHLPMPVTSRFPVHFLMLQQHLMPSVSLLETPSFFGFQNTALLVSLLTPWSRLTSLGNLLWFLYYGS
jgi:hypothetical protein